MGGRFGELILILLIVIVLFGAGKIPRIMGDIGRGIKALRSGLQDEKNPSDEKKED